MASEWNDKRTEMLRDLWPTGLSALLIARRINRDTGSNFTRNAIIGKRIRMKPPLPDRGFTGNGSAYGRSKSRDLSHLRPSRMSTSVLDYKVLGSSKPSFHGFRACSRVDPIPMPQADDKARVSFIDLDERHCRFVIGDPKGPYIKQFCGLERMQGSSWCPGHHARCTDPVRPRRLNSLPESKAPQAPEHIPVRAQVELA